MHTISGILLCSHNLSGMALPDNKDNGGAPFSMNDPQGKTKGMHPFSGFGPNLFHSLIGPTSLLHIAGIGATAILIHRDVDYRVYRYFSKRKHLQPYFYPSLALGTGAWLMTSLPLFIHGRVRSHNESLAASYAVLQANIITFLYLHLLKGITGRPPPRGKWHEDMRRRSHRFNPGFFKKGVFYGWPSGHTGVVMATASSLIWFYPDKIWISIIGSLLVAYTMTGVIVHEGHWLSDTVAAAFMSCAIGSTVGRSFRAMLHPPEKGTVRLLPQAGPGEVVIGVALYF